VAGSVNATMGGRELVTNSTIFSGDSLQVKEGVAVIALGRGSRLVFGRESAVSFSQEADAVTASLGRGNVSLFSSDGGAGVRVKVGEVTIAPAKGFKTIGEVAMANGSFTVSTKEGLLRVEGNGQAVDVAKGKTIAVTPKVARGPSGGSGGGGGGTGLQVVTLGVAGVGAILGGLAYSSASDAKDNASSAIAGAAAAKAAADAATAAANAAAANANAVGCALDQYAIDQGQVSPYAPPVGYSCNLTPRPE